jgi:alkyl hydroperoxide reductase subunit AhpC
MEISTFLVSDLQRNITESFGVLMENGAVLRDLLLIDPEGAVDYLSKCANKCDPRIFLHPAV